jgi:formate-dependent nitrite reductase membrane component NrfD
MTGPQQDAEIFEAFEAKAKEGTGQGPAKARTTYDVNRKPLWGAKITGYLFFKSLAAGTFLAGSLLLEPSGLAVDPTLEVSASRAPLAVPILSMVFLALTLLLLVADLKRPERFLKIMLRPNWNSWLAKGSFVLMGYGMLLTAWLLMGFVEAAPAGFMGWLLIGTTALFAATSAGYTAFLFGQAKGRVLWMKRGYAAHLVVQAVLAGSALLLAVSSTLGLSEAAAGGLGDLLMVALLVHAGLTLAEGQMAPPKRGEEFGRAVRLVSHGPYARLHWIAGLGLGVAVPLALLFVAAHGPLAMVASVLALAGLYVETDIFVRAGQALRIS